MPEKVCVSLKKKVAAAQEEAEYVEKERAAFCHPKDIKFQSVGVFFFLISLQLLMKS